MWILDWKRFVETKKFLSAKTQGIKPGFKYGHSEI
jgi:hypothetical protein